MAVVRGHARANLCGATYLMKSGPEWEGVWRRPAKESAELYPGLVVHDDRVSGSITLGRSRLPMWAFVSWLPDGGWASVEKGWDELYGWNAEKMASFLYDLMEHRGEFARLLLVLADVERREQNLTDRALRRADTDRDGMVRLAFGPDDEGTRLPGAWWEQPKLRARVEDQLRRCLAALALQNTHTSQPGDSDV